MFSTRRSGATEDKGGEKGARAGRPGGRRLPRRLVHLYTGLVLYGLSMGLQLRAGLGLEPWSVLNQGISRHTGLSIGTITIVSGALILLLWIPLRQRPGLGTVSNVVILGLVMDATFALTPDISALAFRIPLLVLAILLNGMATGCTSPPASAPGRGTG